ncbi:FecR family protein [uncultured Draconibacterium sp.]|uniref:FecR family protein n=1 Tax=uncultured Draconibacterium sp. TaxID=1573823 RepID=UPI003216CCAA
MNIEDIYISLILRHLKKEISESEKQELFHWVYCKKENEKFFYNLKDIWETAQYQSIAKTADTDAEWQKLVFKAIQEETDHFLKKSVNTRTIYRAIQIAAVVVITFGIGFFVQKYIPEETNYASVNVPYGAKSELELPDGSKVWVNSGSKIKYPTNVNNKDVTLYLEGEAYFDIVKNPKRLLTVKTSTIYIQVHGTSFNVKSYNDEEIVETTLLEGSISITGKVGNNVIKEPIFLKPNEQATLTKSKQNIEIGQQKHELAKTKEAANDIKKIASNINPKIQIKEGIDVESFVMWKYNMLVFKNERFEDLAIKLERWYDVEITIKNEELKNSRYTGTFEKETVEQAMKALSISLPFKYHIDKNQISIQKI